MDKVDRYAGGGSQVVTLRIDDDLLTAIDAAVSRKNQVSYEGDWSRAKYIKYCIREILGKAGRARKSRLKKLSVRERHDGYGETL